MKRMMIAFKIYVYQAMIMIEMANILILYDRNKREFLGIALPENIRSLVVVLPA